MLATAKCCAALMLANARNRSACSIEILKNILILENSFSVENRPGLFSGYALAFLIFTRARQFADYNQNPDNSPDQ